MEKELHEAFKRRRRLQVLVAIAICFPSWYFGAGRDLVSALIVTAIVAILRWFFFTRNLI
jgi:hypothetical protein